MNKYHLTFWDIGPGGTHEHEAELKAESIRSAVILGEARAQFLTNADESGRVWQLVGVMADEMQTEMAFGRVCWTVSEIIE